MVIAFNLFFFLIFYCISWIFLLGEHLVSVYPLHWL
jgi:hypothetical protein